MKLSDRLKAAQAERFVRRDVAISQLGEAAEPEHAPEDPFSLLKRRAQDALFARLGTRLHDSSLSEDVPFDLTAVVSSAGRALAVVSSELRDTPSRFEVASVTVPLIPPTAG